MRNGANDNVMNKVYIGIVGSRRRNSLNDMNKIYNLVSRLKYKYGSSLVIVSGGCKKGADMFAKKACIKYKVEYEEYLPQIKKGMNYLQLVDRYHARNFFIADKSDYLFAMVHMDRKGGTENTINHAESLNKPVTII